MGPKWYDNPTHPIWGLILVAMIMAGAYWFSQQNAASFDETEYAMLREFAVWTVGVVFGGGGLARLLANRNGSNKQ